MLLAVAAATIAGVAVAARVFVPPWLRETLERVAGEELGRELKIAGTFRLAYSLEPALVAEDVTLANAAWSADPVMIRAERIEIALDLPSLASPPIRIRNVELDGVRVLLERNADGRPNWAFDTKPRPPSPKPTHPVLVDRARIRDLELVFRPGHDAPPRRFGIARLDASHEATSDMVALDAAGNFNDIPWDVAGTLGTLDRLYAVRDVSHDVRGHVGTSRVALRGRIRDPLALGDPEVEVELDGPDLKTSLAALGVSSPISGPFHARAHLAPAEGGAAVELDAGVAGVSASSKARVGKLLGFDGVDATARVQGPDASIVARWFGLEGIPASPFELEGRLRRDGPTVAVDRVAGKVGGIAIEGSGTVPDDLTFAAKGSDLAELSAIARVSLPSGPFAARGRFLKRDDRLAIENVVIESQGAVVRAGGTIGKPPRLELAFDASGTDLSRFSTLAKVALPAAPFEARGRVARRGDAFAFDGIEGRLGEDHVVGSGQLVPKPKLAGSTFDLHATGPDLASTGERVGVKGLAAGPFDVSGTARFDADGWRVDAVKAKAGGIDAEGELRAAQGLEIEGRVAGGSLSSLGAWGVTAGLPEDPFEASGKVHVQERTVRVERVVATVGEDRVAVDGTLGTLPDLPQLDVAVEASGPRLSELARFVTAAGHESPPRLPVEPYSLAGRIRRGTAGFEVEGLRATIADAEIHADGSLAGGLTVDARAPSSRLAAGLAGVELPSGGCSIRGRVTVEGEDVHVDEGTATLGENRASVRGTIGRGETDVDVELSGPSLAELLGSVTGGSVPPFGRFALSAHLEGNAKRLASSRFTATLGANDLEGSLSVERDARTTVTADLRSRHLDLRPVFQNAAGSPEGTPESTKKKPKERLFSDEPLPLDSVRKVDATLRLRAEVLEVPGFLLKDVIVEGSTRNGAVRVDRAEGSGVHGGRASTRLFVEPIGDGYHLRATGSLAGARIVPSEGGVPPDETPTVDLDFEIEGRGRSLHEIAAGSRGGGLVKIGAGRLPGGASGVVTSGVLFSLLDALNPFRRSSPHTDVECAVLATDVVQGQATVEPVAARTDMLTVVGKGKVDLDTEKIDFSWTLKPRRGVGISAASLTNPYIKLGGTLASPSIDAKPLDAAASTGAAVATAGLTLFVRGLYDRLTAEKKVCTRALEEAKARAAQRAAERTPDPP